LPVFYFLLVFSRLLSTANMPSLKAILAITITTSITLASALPTALLSNPLVARQDGSNGATCGDNSYSSDDIANAQNAGCNYLQEGQTVGYDDYV
jgi:hypothetical protein